MKRKLRVGQQSVFLQRWYSEEYDQDRFGGTFGQYLHDEEVGIFLSMINGTGGKILDVGTGTGKLSLPLIRQSRLVSSVDSSLEMLRIAEKKAKREGMVLNSVICDAHRLCFRDKAFECVIASRVLMHLQDWRRGLSELCRVAERTVIIDFPPLIGFAGFHSLFKKVKSVFSKDTQLYKVFLVRSVDRALRKHNFRIVELKRGYLLPIALHRKINMPAVSLKIEKLLRIFGFGKVLGTPTTVKAIKMDI